MPGVKGRSGVYPRTAEHSRQISLGRRGMTFSTLHRRHLSERWDNRLTKAPSIQYWKMIHNWLRRIYGPAAKCENKESGVLGFDCRLRGKFNWANKRGKPYEKNIANFYQLCASCHHRYDLNPKYLRLTKIK